MSVSEFLRFYIRRQGQNLLTVREMEEFEEDSIDPDDYDPEDVYPCDDECSKLGHDTLNRLLRLLREEFTNKKRSIKEPILNPSSLYSKDASGQKKASSLRLNRKRLKYFYPRSFCQHRKSNHDHLFSPNLLSSDWPQIYGIYFGIRKIYQSLRSDSDLCHNYLTTSIKQGTLYKNECSENDPLLTIKFTSSPFQKRLCSGVILLSKNHSEANGSISFVGEAIDFDQTAFLWEYDTKKRNYLSVRRNCSTSGSKLLKSIEDELKTLFRENVGAKSLADMIDRATVLFTKASGVGASVDCMANKDTSSTSETFTGSETESEEESQFRYIDPDFHDNPQGLNHFLASNRHLNTTRLEQLIFSVRHPNQHIDIFETTTALENLYNLPPFNALPSIEDVYKSLLCPDCRLKLKREYIIMHWKLQCGAVSKKPVSAYAAIDRRSGHIYLTIPSSISSRFSRFRMDELEFWCMNSLLTSRNLRLPAPFYDILKKQVKRSPTDNPLIAQAVNEISIVALLAQPCLLGNLYFKIPITDSFNDSQWTSCSSTIDSNRHQEARKHRLDDKTSDSKFSSSTRLKSTLNISEQDLFNELRDVFNKDKTVKFTTSTAQTLYSYKRY